MTAGLDRRQTIRLACAAMIAGPSAAATRSATELTEREPPLSATLAHTRYFEIESQAANARYAVWVTTPPTYEREAKRSFPVIYVPDGNGAAPLTIPRDDLLTVDPIAPIQPFIQVCVGYAGPDVARSLAVRARDLLPPGEPPPPGLDADDAMASTVASGLLDEAGAKLYAYNLRHPAGDKFLAFLTNELHPLIAAQWRVAPGGHGLFGYSYGGLFATYVALSRTPLFTRVGAGSPGILPKISSVFALYEAALNAKADFAGRILHMTVNALELTAASYYQPLVGAGTTEFLALAGQRPLSGLAFSSRIIDDESHATGFSPSWFSFLRACYSAARSATPRLER